MKINNTIKNLIHTLNYKSLYTIQSKIDYVMENNIATPNELMYEISWEILTDGFMDKWRKNQFAKISESQTIELINKSNILNIKNKKFNSIKQYMLFRSNMMKILFLCPSYKIYKCLENNGLFNTEIKTLYNKNPLFSSYENQLDILEKDMHMMKIFLNFLDEEYENTNWQGKLKEDNEAKEKERLLIAKDIIPLFIENIQILEDQAQKTQYSYIKPNFYSPLILKIIDKSILEKNTLKHKKQYKIKDESKKTIL